MAARGTPEISAIAGMDTFSGPMSSNSLSAASTTFAMRVAERVCTGLRVRFVEPVVATESDIS
ncbi:hypothetical protein D3C78_1573930 [compost metagenome]